MANASSLGRTEDDLSRRVVLALEFACGVLDDVDSDPAARKFDGAGKLSGIAEKVVAETAMLLYAVAHLRATFAAVGTACANLATRLIPLARNANVQAAVCMDPKGHREAEAYVI